MPESEKSEKEKPNPDDESPKQETKKEKVKKKEDKKDEEKEKEKELKIKKVDYGPDFKYIVRLMNTDLDGTRPLVLGLTRINGIGHRVARVIANMAHLDHHQLLGRLSDSDLANLEGVLKNFSDTAPEFVMNRQNDPESGKSMHLFSQDLTLYRTHDINLMKKIRCYKGIRHETGHKVRGQRTKSNGRKGLALGVIRQKALAEAKAKGESEGKSKEEKK